MPKLIDYYLTPTSPWTYLGHARFADIAKRHGATVAVKPADYDVIFPQSGGLPLGKRAPQRQAYRLAELARWRDSLGVSLGKRGFNLFFVILAKAGIQNSLPCINFRTATRGETNTTRWPRFALLDLG